MSKHSSYTKSRQRSVSHKTERYALLHQYRLDWEAKGHTRGELRKMRRLQRTLFPAIIVEV